MERIYVETSGAGLVYESDMELKQYLEAQKDTLEFPGLKICENIPKGNHDYIKYRDSELKYIHCCPNGIEISYPSSELTPASIIFMGYILMEKQRMEKYMLTAHSACVGKDNSAIFLLGKAGSGKTSVALKLCLDYDYSLISNDRTVIGLNGERKLAAFAGTKFIFLRYESIKRNLPQLLGLFPEIVADSWLTKTKVFPEDIGITKTDSLHRITNSYMVHVDERKSELYVANGDTPANRLFLNEIFSMYIRGIYTTFCDKNFNAQGYIPSYDNEIFYKNRCEIINALLENNSLQYVSGNVDAVSQYIDERQKKMVYNKNERKGVKYV